jgi:hypothetical protein
LGTVDELQLHLIAGGTISAVPFQSNEFFRSL